MSIAIYPGSFDPITKGHLNIITRAAKSFDKLIICCMVNSDKHPMFNLEERVDLIRRVTAGIENVEVDFYVPDDELAIQVSYSIESAGTTEKREVEALQKLPKALSCKRRLIITYDEEKYIEDEYGTIEVVPCWKWLIQQ